MGTVLYEYTFNLTDFLLCFIPLAVGVGFLTNSIMLVKSKQKEKGWEGFNNGFFKVIGFIVGPIAIMFFVLLIAGMSTEHLEYKEMLANDDVYTVEGYVEKYSPMPYEGHTNESFEINGVLFEYSDYEIVNGYHQAASHGGVVTHNGQYLKIKYVQEEVDETNQNVILYIEEISEKSIEDDSRKI